MAARSAALVLVPLLALAGTTWVAGEAGRRQEASGKTSLFHRAQDWQRAASDPRGLDPRRLADFYASARGRDLPDPRLVADSRLLAVDVLARGTRGRTVHAVEVVRRGRLTVRAVAVDWAREAGGRWTVVGWDET